MACGATTNGQLQPSASPDLSAVFAFPPRSSLGAAGFLRDTTTADTGYTISLAGITCMSTCRLIHGKLMVKTYEQLAEFSSHKNGHAYISVYLNMANT